MTILGYSKHSSGSRNALSRPSLLDRLLHRGPREAPLPPGAAAAAVSRSEAIAREIEAYLDAIRRDVDGIGGRRS